MHTIIQQSRIYQLQRVAIQLTISSPNHIEQLHKAHTLNAHLVSSLNGTCNIINMQCTPVVTTERILTYCNYNQMTPHNAKLEIYINVLEKNCNITNIVDMLKL